MGLRDVGVLEKELLLMTKHNVSFVTSESDDYPKALKNIYASPVVLYVQSIAEEKDSNEPVSKIEEAAIINLVMEVAKEVDKAKKVHNIQIQKNKGKYLRIL